MLQNFGTALSREEMRNVKGGDGDSSYSCTCKCGNSNGALICGGNCGTSTCFDLIYGVCGGLGGVSCAGGAALEV